MRSSKIIFWAISIVPFLTQSGYATGGHDENTRVPIPSAAAGVVDREIADEYNAKEVQSDKEVPLFEVDMPEEQLHLNSSETVFVEKIEIHGNDALSSHELLRAVFKFQGRDLTMKEIRTICQIIQQTYVKQGYFLARAYPPAQEIKNGTLVIEVLEGRLGDIYVEGNKFYKTKFIESYFTRFRNHAVNYDDLLKALLLINERNDLQVGAVFKKGSSFGTADVILKVSDKRPFHLNLNSNNYGSHSTSIYRTGARINYGNIFFDGDDLSLVEVIGSPIRNLKFTQARYALPLTSRGTDFELSYMYSAFHVTKLTDLELAGQSYVAEARIKQALQRTRSFSTDIYSSFDYKQIKNYAQDKIATFDKLRVLTGGFTVDYFDPYKGRTVGDISAAWGIPNIMEGSKPVDKECSREGSGGRYLKFNGHVQHIRQLPYYSFLFFNAAGQVSSYDLPLAELIYIGGIDTVRGFKLSTVLGDTGFYANLEYRFPIPFLADKHIYGKKLWKDFIQLIGFLDHGHIYLHNNALAGQNRHEVLTSTGCALRIYAPLNINFSFDLGFPLSAHRRPKNIPVIYWKVGWQIF